LNGLAYLKYFFFEWFLWLTETGTYKEVYRFPLAAHAEFFLVFSDGGLKSDGFKKYFRAKSVV
jgi:hypothetical protein